MVYVPNVSSLLIKQLSTIPVLPSQMTSAFPFRIIVTPPILNAQKNQKTLVTLQLAFNKHYTNVMFILLAKCRQLLRSSFLTYITVKDLLNKTFVLIYIWC